MQTTSNPVATGFKTLFITGLSLFIFACNSSKKEEQKDDTITKDTSITAEPPAIPPPNVSMEPVAKKCFESDGLKYKTTITISSSATDVTGTVTSEESGSGEKQSAEFTGKINGDMLTVTFKGTAPVVGAASAWTNKPWIIKKSGDKEKLLIVFDAKNYGTNKWENTTYEFVSCK